MCSRHPYKMMRGFGHCAMVAFGVMLVTILAAGALAQPAVMIGFLKALAIEIEHGDVRSIQAWLVGISVVSFLVGAASEAVRRLTREED